LEEEVFKGIVQLKNKNYMNACKKMNEGFNTATQGENNNKTII